MWDLASEWKLERTIGSVDAGSVFADRVTSLDFSPDGKTLAVGSGEGVVSGVRVYLGKDFTSAAEPGTVQTLNPFAGATLVGGVFVG